MCCCGVGFAKCVLITLNILTFIVGVFVFVLGFLAKFNQDVILQMFNFIPEQLMNDINNAWDIPSLLEEAAVLLMVVGAFIFVVSFLGCCGGIKEYRCFLGMYIGVVGLLLILQVITIILIIVKTNGAHETIVSGLQKSIDKNYIDSDGGLSFDDEGKLKFAIRPIKLAWDGVQVLMSCCGALNSTDYLKAKFHGEYNFTHDGDTIEVKNAKIPLSCCSFVSKEEYEENRPADDQQSRFSMPTTKLSKAKNAKQMVQGCLSDLDPKYIHDDGCYKTFLQLIEEYWAIFVGVLVTIMLIEIFSLTFACVILKHNRNKGKPI